MRAGSGLEAGTLASAGKLVKPYVVTVRRGAAIAREYPPDTALASALAQAQAGAQQEQLGLWHSTACGPTAGSNVAVLHIEADAPGDDNNPYRSVRAFEVRAPGRTVRPCGEDAGQASGVVLGRLWRSDP